MIEVEATRVELEARVVELERALENILNVVELDTDGKCFVVLSEADGEVEQYLGPELSEELVLAEEILFEGQLDEEG